MNERITTTELKYNNKQKLKAAYRSFEVIKSATMSLKEIVDDLYKLVQLNMAQLTVTNLERSILREDDILIGDGGN